MEQQLKDHDFFAVYPFFGFKNAGIYNQTCEWEWRKNDRFACFYIVTRGEVFVTLDDGRKFTAHESDALFLKSMDKATMGCNNPNGSEHIFVSFYYDEGFDLGIDTLVMGTDAKTLAHDIYEAHHSVYPLARFKLYTHFMKLVYLLSSKTLKGSKEYWDVSQIQSAAEYINLNCQKKITEKELCHISGYSPAHLRRLFVKHYARSPQDYILDRRLEMAKELLLDRPPRSVQEIAELLGICSPSYFCKLFKQRVGLTPMEYKEKYDV